MLIEFLVRLLYFEPKGKSATSQTRFHVAHRGNASHASVRGACRSTVGIAHRLDVKQRFEEMNETYRHVEGERSVQGADDASVGNGATVRGDEPDVSTRLCVFCGEVRFVLLFLLNCCCNTNAVGGQGKHMYVVNLNRFPTAIKLCGLYRGEKRNYGNVVKIYKGAQHAHEGNSILAGARGRSQGLRAVYTGGGLSPIEDVYDTLREISARDTRGGRGSRRRASPAYMSDALSDALLHF